MRSFRESTAFLRKLVVVSAVGTAAACSSAPAIPDADAGVGGTSGTGGSAPTGGTGGTAPVPPECVPAAVPVTTPWGSVNRMGAAFYGTPEALTIAQNILYYQNSDRGWPKDTDMTSRDKSRSRSTIDNGATTTQVEYLSRVYAATSCANYRDAAIAGLEYLFSGQYMNGGWPQEFPNGDGYHRHITFNDNAMLHVLTLLRQISLSDELYAYLDASYAPRAGEAVQKGIDCILRCEVVSETQAGWCAQHDEVSLAPAQARTYELPSLSGSEGVGIVRFLMTIDDPSPEVRDAIEGAVAWFDAVKIEGIRIDSVTDPNQPTGEDRVVVEDATAEPLWARFYELETNRPIFSSRCEVPECDTNPNYMMRYSLAEIDNERRVGYSWYGDWPAKLLNTDYPAWKAKWPEP